MATDIHHAISSTRRWGGEAEDYLHIHKWFDDTKTSMPDYRHRALRHHAEGITQCVEIFGDLVTLSTGKTVPTRWVAEQHVMEDMGRIPVAADWLRCMTGEKWMNAEARRFQKQFDQEEQG